MAVLARGPSAWCQTGRWDLEPPAYQSGSWLHGVLHPQRCDLSPDGRWLAYFVNKAAATWAPGGTYLAISRLPWLRALAAWGTDGTWTTGVHFVEDTSAWELPEPDAGDPGPCRRRYGIRRTRAASFAVERRRGWAESAATPARDPGDAWDQRRSGRITLQKAEPTGGALLEVRGDYAETRSLHGLRTDAVYTLRSAGWEVPLEDVQWADWDRRGRLLAATRDGRIQVRRSTGDGWVTEWEHTLPPRPDPVPPPPEAGSW